MIPHEGFPVVLLIFLKVFTPHKMLFLFSSNFVFLLFENVRCEWTFSLLYIKNACLKFMVSLQSIIWVFLLNNFSHVINLFLTKLARDRNGRISALGLFCTDRAQRGPYCQDLRPIFSQYGPHAWLIRYIYETGLSQWNDESLLKSWTGFNQYTMLLQELSALWNPFTTTK